MRPRAGERYIKLVPSCYSGEARTPVNGDPTAKVVLLTNEPSVFGLFVGKLRLCGLLHIGHKETELLRGFVYGVITVAVVGLLVAYLGITQGLLIPANADAKPGKLETWAARASLRAILGREAPKLDNPLAPTDANLIGGVKLYAANCAVCHGAADGKASTIAKGLYQRPPQLGTDGVEDDPDGVTYWKIAHGIRLTGMPAFGHSLTDNQVWELALFLKHMDKLPPAAQRVWKSVKNPAPIVARQ